MGAGWVDGDLQSEKRRNREWILGRLRAPAYDVNDIGTVTVDAKAVDGMDVPLNVYQRHYLVPSTVTVAMVHSMTFLNRHSTNQSLEVLLGASTSGASFVVFETIAPGDTLTLQGPWFLKPTDTIWTRSLSGGNVISARFEVTEFTGATPGVTLAVVDGVQLQGFLGGYYICPFSARNSLIAAITLCNAYPAAVVVGVAVVPAGSIWGLGQHYVFNGAVYPGETVILDGYVMEPGDVLGVGANVASAVSARISPIEFTL